MSIGDGGLVLVNSFYTAVLQNACLAIILKKFFDV